MRNILPPTTKRVAIHTNSCTNKEIRDKTLRNIRVHKDSGEAILADKIEKLNYEWDTERFLETNAALIVLVSAILGYRKKKSRWFLLSGTVGFFLLQHGLQGWCPPLPVIRKFGVRTSDEITNEKNVYKKIRGDFLQDTNDPHNLLGMTEK